MASQTGVLREVSDLDAIRSLRSFRKVDLLTQPGALVTPTVDCFTSPGAVQLVHANVSVLEADQDAVRALEREHKIFTMI